MLMISDYSNRTRLENEVRSLIEYNFNIEKCQIHDQFDLRDLLICENDREQLLSSFDYQFGVSLRDLMSSDGVITIRTVCNYLVKTLRDGNLLTRFGFKEGIPDIVYYE